MLAGVAGSMPPDDAFAVHHDEQYRPAEVAGGEWLRVGGAHGGVLLCHASRAPGSPDPNASRLLVVVHGALRNAAHYLECARAAAGLAGAASRTLIVAPQFLADVDVRPGPAAAAPGADLPPDTLYWDVEGWKGGQPALAPAPVSSFTAMDDLLRQLAGEVGTTPRYPVVVIAGNSAGGQFVNRYAIVGREPDALAARGVTVRFVVANPSSYLYFSAERPVAPPGAPPPGTPAVNRWRYGFDDPPGYVDGNPREYLERYLRRDVTILLGEQDHDPAALLLEVNPPAMAQGANRLERGVHYHEHVRTLAAEAGLPARHRLIRLPGVGHDAADVLAAAQARDILVPRHDAVRRPGDRVRPRFESGDVPAYRGARGDHGEHQGQPGEQCRGGRER
jgi:hypothetical protein